MHQTHFNFQVLVNYRLIVTVIDFAIIAVIPSIFCAFAELLSPPEVDNLIITAAAILSTYVLYVCGYTFLIASQISQFNR